MTDTSPTTPTPQVAHDTAPEAARCQICRRPLDVADDPTTRDCGGDCLRCMAEAGDPDCLASMRAIESARIQRRRRRLLAAALAGYGTISAAFGLLWGLGTNVAWSFVAFVTVAWPWWMMAGWTGAGWMVDILPGTFFTLR